MCQETAQVTLKAFAERVIKAAQSARHFRSEGAADLFLRFQMSPTVSVWGDMSVIFGFCFYSNVTHAARPVRSGQSEGVCIFLWSSVGRYTQRCSGAPAVRNSRSHQRSVRFTMNQSKPHFSFSFCLFVIPPNKAQETLM